MRWILGSVLAGVLAFGLVGCGDKPAEGLTCPGCNMPIEEGKGTKATIDGKEVTYCTQGCLDKAQKKEPPKEE